VPWVCTVATRSHLASASTLLTSVVQASPDWRTAVLVVDDHEDDLPDTVPGASVVLTATQLGLDEREVRRRGAMFGPLGLACSLKAPTVRHLVDRHGDAVVHMDSDSWVLGSLSEVEAAIRRDGVLLTPHLTSPRSRATAGYPVEETFLKYGVYNAGLVGAGPDDLDFLDWWTDRTRRRCVVAPEQGLNTDQLWLQLAPAYFRTVVLHRPVINLTWWALYGSDLIWSTDPTSPATGPAGRDGIPAVTDPPRLDGVPVVHAHFTGIRFRPGGGVVVTDGERAGFPDLGRRPGFRRLCDAYRLALDAAETAGGPRPPVPFITLPDGRSFDRDERDRYREAVEWAEVSGSDEPVNPFDA